MCVYQKLFRSTYIPIKSKILLWPESQLNVSQFAKSPCADFPPTMCTHSLSLTQIFSFSLFGKCLHKKSLTVYNRDEHVRWNFFLSVKWMKIFTYIYMHAGPSECTQTLRKEVSTQNCTISFSVCSQHSFALHVKFSVAGSRWIWLECARRVKCDNNNFYFNFIIIFRLVQNKRQERSF